MKGSSSWVSRCRTRASCNTCSQENSVCLGWKVSLMMLFALHRQYDNMNNKCAQWWAAGCWWWIWGVFTAHSRALQSEMEQYLTDNASSGTVETTGILRRSWLARYLRRIGLFRDEPRLVQSITFSIPDIHLQFLLFLSHLKSSEGLLTHLFFRFSLK